MKLVIVESNVATAKRIRRELYDDFDEVVIVHCPDSTVHQSVLTRFYNGPTKPILDEIKQEIQHCQNVCIICNVFLSTTEKCSYITDHAISNVSKVITKVYGNAYHNGKDSNDAINIAIISNHDILEYDCKRLLGNTKWVNALFNTSKLVEKSTFDSIRKILKGQLLEGDEISDTE